VVLAASWLALALGLGAPWIVRLLTTSAFYDGARVVAPLAFSGVAFGAYAVVLISIGRARRTRSNWLITGAAALLNLVLNLLLIPPYGMIGAAVSTVSAYALMFLGMAWKAQRVFRVPYQWRRVGMALGAAISLTLAGKLLDANLPVAVALVLVYPLALGLLGFYLPAERARIGRLLPGAR
jgi:O-antigen/teichoic acid export membrane protein